MDVYFLPRGTKCFINAGHGGRGSLFEIDKGLR